MVDFHLAWIALGSNIDPETNLPQAVSRLREVGDVVKCSSVWESQPVGFADQANFCNAAIQLRTTLTPAILKQALLKIEHDLKRVRDPSNPNGPRTIDLDIALYDSEIIESAEMTIPDPDIPERAFLIVPLAELDPSFEHPLLGATLGSLAAGCGGIGELIRREDVRLAER